MHNKQPDVLLISETWLTPFSPRLDIPGYELYRQDRVHKKGGVWPSWSPLNFAALTDLTCPLN